MPSKVPPRNKLDKKSMSIGQIFEGYQHVHPICLANRAFVAVQVSSI